MKYLPILLCAWALAACTTTPRGGGGDALFDDAQFGPPSARIDLRAAMAPTPAMKQFVSAQLLPAARSVGPQQALLDALGAPSLLRLDYDAKMTRNAGEAFDARAGNCLSLVLMTAALAEELGLPVRFQSVRNEETWERGQPDLFFLIGHVNLKVGDRPYGQARSAWSFVPSQDWMVIDFLPGVDLRRQRAREIGADQVLAMYANNRAAEALAQGQLDDAYAWLREAVRADAGYLSTYNTLGVVYQRRGALPQAERALRFALAQQPDNVHALGNLAVVLRKLGRDGEADAAVAQLRRLQPVAPFAWFREGVEAYRAGNFRRARDLFQKEIDRAGDYHEFHYWMALTLSSLGDFDRARRHLHLALENSSTREQSAIYAAKLQRLKAHGLQ